MHLQAKRGATRTSSAFGPVGIPAKPFHLTSRPSPAFIVLDCRFCFEKLHNWPLDAVTTSSPSILSSRRLLAPLWPCSHRCWSPSRPGLPRPSPAPARASSPTSTLPLLSAQTCLQPSPAARRPPATNTSSAWARPTSPAPSSNLVWPGMASLTRTGLACASVYTAAPSSWPRGATRKIASLISCWTTSLATRQCGTACLMPWQPWAASTLRITTLTAWP